jgi:hypothetical protein
MFQVQVYDHESMRWVSVETVSSEYVAEDIATNHRIVGELARVVDVASVEVAS